ncbi:MAG: ABC transporter substrate-binding protein [Ilumatobacteraceae bacterium]
MSDQTEHSPHPRDVGFSINRRQMLAGASALSLAAFLAACGSDEKSAPDTTAAPTTTAAASPDSTAPVGSTAPAPSGDTVTFGSNYSDDKPKQAIQAAIDSTGLNVKVNTTDHNSFQDNITNYLAQPDDVLCWFSGYRMRFFADKGLIGDISDVWDGLGDFNDSFKSASTGNDGKQYFVPFYYYPWAVHYRKSVFADKGYEVPTNKAELVALATKMQADGLIPFAYANDGKWPVQGTFDIINMRTNGYQYHIDLLAGKESWTDDRTKATFAAWAELLPFHQENPNGRTWQEAATALENKEAGMYFLGTFVATNSTDQAYLDDLDFFNFPELDSAVGADALDAPIDGFMMAADPKNLEGAKALLSGLGSAEAIDAFLAIEGASVAASSAADTSGYNKIQAKSAELVGAAKNIAQFLDRDTSPDFVSNVIGDAFASFVADPSQVDSILSGIEEQKSTYLG